jgi:hypothetical protein
MKQKKIGHPLFIPIIYFAIGEKMDNGCPRFIHAGQKTRYGQAADARLVPTFGSAF